MLLSDLLPNQSVYRDSLRVGHGISDYFGFVKEV